MRLGDLPHQLRPSHINGPIDGARIRSDLEEGLEAWLHSHGQDDLWQLASDLARKNVKPVSLESLFAILERLAHHLFALLPERLGVGGIERVSTHTFTDPRNRSVVRDDCAYVAVLTIFATDLGSRSHHRSPH
jgi:hypothetical protein